MEDNKAMEDLKKQLELDVRELDVEQILKELSEVYQKHMESGVVETHAVAAIAGMSFARIRQACILSSELDQRAHVARGFIVVLEACCMASDLEVFLSE